MKNEVETVRDCIRKLNADVTNVVRQFEQDTGLSVTGIEVSNFSCQRIGSVPLTSVVVSVELGV